MEPPLNIWSALVHNTEPDLFEEKQQALKTRPRAKFTRPSDSKMKQFEFDSNEDSPNRDPSGNYRRLQSTEDSTRRKFGNEKHMFLSEITKDSRVSLAEGTLATEAKEEELVRSLKRSPQRMMSLQIQYDKDYKKEEFQFERRVIKEKERRESRSKEGMMQELNEYHEQVKVSKVIPKKERMRGNTIEKMEDWIDGNKKAWRYEKEILEEVVKGRINTSFLNESLEKIKDVTTNYGKEKKSNFKLEPEKIEKEDAEHQQKKRSEVGKQSMKKG